MANSTIKAIRPNWNAIEQVPSASGATKTYSVPDGLLLITRSTTINMLFCIAHSGATRIVKKMVDNGSSTNLVDVSIDANGDVKIVNNSLQSLNPLFYY